MSIDIAALRASLVGRAPRAAAIEGKQRAAAVAAVVRPRGPDTEVLLIRRASREGDPWSGHVAFPGGKVEPHDPDLRATAERETREEVGLDLRRHRFLGQLDDVPARARGFFTGIVISPYVFELAEPAPLRPNEEVAAIFWASLGAMHRGELDTHKHLEYEGERKALPAFGVGEHIVWGLTHHMIRELLTVVARARGGVQRA